MGIINIGGPAVIAADDQTYEVDFKRLFGFLLYGSKLVFFTSVGVSFPQNTPDATAMRHP